MKLCFLSDTHGQHKKVKVPDADVLVHCGDFCTHGRIDDALDFLEWFYTQPHKHKIFISGNHDWVFYRMGPSELSILKSLPENVHYLCESGVEIEGFKFWGSPETPEFLSWAFMYPRFTKSWEDIPLDTNVLITHGPPHGVLDLVERGEHVGCERLAEAVLKVKPKIHAFGHIHTSPGWVKLKDTSFINCSVLNDDYQLVYAPIVLEINHGKKEAY